MSSVGEGMVTNLSAVGCMIEADQPLPEEKKVAFRLLLTDQHRSLPIDKAQVTLPSNKNARRLRLAAAQSRFSRSWPGIAARFRSRPAR
jgi:hypothetical protein